ncbi:DNA helicase RecQ [Aliifodinibius sp. S!AR15-10]|uniref:DNA helicase RecQ n=1 Tax=Aliifodinibius sp. S!AR15-10 TaxID=2950437 RepID=UPI00286577AA|nr:DNA helicase RecQ [Aliifodinibius sp. S!AR15-10]MDR8392461.1 DNA helicase RecQ [Aliifodinibius sp. S!AR15-10]
MMQQAREALTNVFGFKEFRPLQEEVIDHVLQKNDALVVMPTGGGKSLCYQIPALIFDGLTIVVSPLISLMKDQVEQLREYNISAVQLNSTLSQQEYQHNVDLLKRGEVSLLYLAPETLLMSRTKKLLKSLDVDSFTIDEAHCISEWGHDFRPEYRKLAMVRKNFPDAVTIALTATATPRVQDDIKRTLELKETEAFIASFNRTNLFLEIRDKHRPLDQVLTFLDRHENQSGIIYCFSRKQVDELAEELEYEGFSVRPYHAGLSEGRRNNNQEAFIKDDVDIIVATIAFGMGINKPDVRFVVHYDMPQNIEAYYQQIGRAGRDGLQADCLMLFSYSDINKIKYFINKKQGQEKKVAERHLNALLQFIENNKCRRIPLMDYFGETYPSDTCDMCDNCVGSPQEVEDLTEPAQKFLSCIVRTDQHFGATHITKILRGSEAKKVKEHGHTELSTHGIGRELSKKQWKKLSEQLLIHGFLERDPEYGSLKLKQSGIDLLKGRKALYGRINTNNKSADRDSARTAASAEKLDYDETFFKQLRQKRKELADKADVPPYVIFPDTTLIEMAYYFPQNEESMRAIHGIGSAKLNKYGDEFGRLIKQYCEEHGIEEKKKRATKTRRSSRPRAGKFSKKRHHEVGPAYNNGQSINELMDEYDVKMSTILKHLRKYYKEDNPLRPEGFLEVSGLDEQAQDSVLQAYEKHGPDLLRPVHEELDGEISYKELKIMRLYYLAQMG